MKTGISIPKNISTKLLVISDTKENSPNDSTKKKAWMFSFIDILLMFILVMIFCCMFCFCHRSNLEHNSFNTCQFTIVESIPENLTFGSHAVNHLSTFEAWKLLLKEANTEIDLGEFYFTLKNEDVTPIKMKSAWQGEEILADLVSSGRDRNIKIRIAQNSPSNEFQMNDVKILENEGGAEVRTLNFDHLLGAGILHTKMWIVDRKHIYLGSANMDWQSLTQVKELGLLIQNCSCIAQDMQKIFEVYWLLGKKGATIPSEWPSSLSTSFNVNNQFRLMINDSLAHLFVSSSPLQLNPQGRTNDIDSILSIIQSADEFVYIAVMDYFPRMLYSKHGTKYWPVIDDALRKVALEKKVHVRLMASHWNHSRADLVHWLNSLQSLSGIHYPSISIETKLFVVPAFTDDQKALAFGRVNHNKYMVTDKTAFIGTSNWSGDYFVNTGGVSIAITPEDRSNNTIRDQLKAVFERDWNSPYAKNLTEFL